MISDGEARRMFSNEEYRKSIEKYQEKPKGDLISREALKKKLTAIKLYEGVYCKAITEKDIDEAPTVYPEEISKLIEKCIREIPQLIEAITENLPQLIEAAAEKIIEEDTRSEQARWRDGE